MDDAVKHQIGALIYEFGGAVAKFDRFEPRGANFYQDGGAKGPDLEITINRGKTFIDDSAIADDTAAHRQDFPAVKSAVTWRFNLCCSTRYDLLSPDGNVEADLEQDWQGGSVYSKSWFVCYL